MSQIINLLEEPCRQHTMNRHVPLTASFTSLVLLQAARLFDVPLVGIIIADNDRLWWKSLHCTIAKKWTETPRERTPTSYLILSGKLEVLVVEDSQEDARLLPSHLRITSHLTTPVCSCFRYSLPAFLFCFHCRHHQNQTLLRCFRFAAM